MDLAEYMKQTGMKDGDLARLVERNPSNVSRWRTKKTRPDFNALVRLQEITGGKVTPADFMDRETA